MEVNKPSNSQERIKELMKYFSVTQTDISKATGIGRSSISNYVLGIREPKQDSVYLISKAYNVDPVWLMGFDVPMFKSEFADALDVIKEHDEDKAILIAYHKADDVTKEMVRRILGL